MWQTAVFEVAGSLPETVAQADVTSLLNVIIKGDSSASDSKLAKPEHTSRFPTSPSSVTNRHLS